MENRQDRILRAAFQAGLLALFAGGYHYPWLERRIAAAATR